MIGNPIFFILVEIVDIRKKLLDDVFINLTPLFVLLHQPCDVGLRAVLKLVIISVHKLQIELPFRHPSSKFLYKLYNINISKSMNGRPVKLIYYFVLLVRFLMHLLQNVWVLDVVWQRVY